MIVSTVEPPNNGHVGDECFVHYLEVVPSSEVLTCIQLLARGTQFVHCREVVRSSECPLSEVPLYSYFSRYVIQGGVHWMVHSLLEFEARIIAR